MSKQSNQRYRKEKEREHLKKAGIDSTSSDSGRNARNKSGSSHELDAPSDSRK